LAEQREETEHYIRQLEEKQEEEAKRINILRQEKQAQVAEVRFSDSYMSIHILKQNVSAKFASLLLIFK